MKWMEKRQMAHSRSYITEDGGRGERGGIVSISAMKKPREFSRRLGMVSRIRQLRIACQRNRAS